MLNRLSDNVAPVKHFLGVLTRALRRARHFALVEGSAIPTNPFQVRNSVRPMHLFGHTFDHNYYFELPSEGKRDAQSIARCFTSHHDDFQAVPRANRTLSTAHNPIPCASSSKGEPPVCAPWPPWRFSVRAASSGGHTTLSCAVTLPLTWSTRSVGHKASGARLLPDREWLRAGTC